MQVCHYSVRAFKCEEVDEFWFDYSGLFGFTSSLLCSWGGLKIFKLQMIALIEMITLAAKWIEPVSR